MKTTLMAFTALAGVLAITGGAIAQSNFQAPKVVIQPQVMRPVITPPVDTRRLTNNPAPAEIPEAEKPDEGEQAAGQSGPTDQTSLGDAVAPESLPDSGQATRMRRRSALTFAPLPEAKPGGGIAGAGPQPEPPTIETGATGRGTHSEEDLLPSQGRRIPDHLRLALEPEDLAAMRDLMEWLRGQRAVDLDALGGGTGQKPGSRLDWEERTGHDRERGPGVISRLQEQRASIDPSSERDGTDDGRRSSRGSSFFGPSARAGSVVSRGALTSQDGVSEDEGDSGGDGLDRAYCGWNCVKYRYETDEGTATEVTRWYPGAENTSDDGDMTNGAEGGGYMENEVVIVHPDGTQTRSWGSGRFDKDGNFTPLVGGSETVVPPLAPVIINAPARQPADPQYGSGGDSFFFECFDPVAPCIRSDVEPEDTVSQPSVGDSETAQGSGPSVGERLRAITQPVPDTTGSGRTGNRSQPPDPCIAAGECDDRRPGEP